MIVQGTMLLLLCLGTGVPRASEERKCVGVGVCRHFLFWFLSMLSLKRNHQRQPFVSRSCVKMAGHE